MRPFRILAAILLLIVGAEIIAILNTPTYSAELAAAKAAYEEAYAEHETLKKAASAYAAGWTR